jgi:glycerol-3-phosphate acyltransferase PlsY
MTLSPLALIDFDAVPAWALVLASYLIGAIPFGLILSQAFKGVDPRTVGSGNIGATNTIRAAGRTVGLTSFALDVFKGAALVVLLRGGAQEHLGPYCFGAAVIGHCYPVYLGFRGGKGVATLVGGILAIDPMMLVYGVGAWLLVLLTTRFVGLASLAMVAAFAIGSGIRHGFDQSATLVQFGLLVMIVWRHRGNLRRILEGSEPKAFEPKPADFHEAPNE